MTEFASADESRSGSVIRERAAAAVSALLARSEQPLQLIASVERNA